MFHQNVPPMVKVITDNTSETGLNCAHGLLVKYTMRLLWAFCI